MEQLWNNFYWFWNNSQIAMTHEHYVSSMLVLRLDARMHRKRSLRHFEGLFLSCYAPQPLILLISPGAFKTIIFGTWLFREHREVIMLVEYTVKSGHVDFSRR